MEKEWEGKRLRSGSGAAVRRPFPGSYVNEIMGSDQPPYRKLMAYLTALTLSGRRLDLCSIGSGWNLRYDHQQQIVVHRSTPLHGYSIKILSTLYDDKPSGETFSMNEVVEGPSDFPKWFPLNAIILQSLRLIGSAEAEERSGRRRSLKNDMIRGG